MNVLSLFDGMSCGQIALLELGMKVDNYFASEINCHAIEQTQLNFPGTVQLGDVRKVRAKDLPRIDLLIGGSPCQGFSFAGKQLNFNDPRSALFFEFVRIWHEVKAVNPDARFMLENVRMDKRFENIISEYLGIRPVRINSSLVSAQERVRLYWSDIRICKEGLFGEVYTDIPLPEDRGILLVDILQPESEVATKYHITKRSTIERIKRRLDCGSNFAPRVNPPKSGTLTVGNNSSKMSLTTGTTLITPQIYQRPHGGNKGGFFGGKTPTLTSSSWHQNNLLVSGRRVIQLNGSRESNGRQPFQQNRVYSVGGISPALCSAHAGSAPAVLLDGYIRRLTPTECARLQTIPSWYKWGCSETQQYKMLGNGWTVEVIKHILSFLNTRIQ